MPEMKSPLEILIDESRRISEMQEVLTDPKTGITTRGRCIHGVNIMADCAECDAVGHKTVRLKSITEESAECAALERKVLDAAKEWHLSRLDQIGDRMAASGKLSMTVLALINFESQHKQ